MTNPPKDFPSTIGHIGVFLGGTSNERSVSLRSGKAIHRALASSGYHVSMIDTVNGYQRILKSKKLDFAFPALHGTGGEDGTIQKILRKHRIPFVGSNEKASACAFDKYKAKEIFLKFGIPTPQFDLVTKKNWKRVLNRWKAPYVLKPVCEGSSIAVAMVAFESEGRKAVKGLLKSYSKILIETKIIGRELTVPIVGGQALPSIEIKTRRNFYDYRAKYSKGLTQYFVPAPIPQKLAKRLRSIAVKANGKLGLEDLSRVDLMVDRFNNPFVLEVNSIPGFTETSLLPKAARSAGMNFSELCVRLLKLAYRRQKDRENGHVV